MNQALEALTEIARSGPHFVAYMKARQAELGWSNHHLAKRAGVSARAIQYLQAGQHTDVRLSVACRIAHVLAFPLVELTPKP